MDSQDFTRRMENVIENKPNQGEELNNVDSNNTLPLDLTVKQRRREHEDNPTPVHISSEPATLKGSQNAPSCSYSVFSSQLPSSGSTLLSHNQQEVHNYSESSAPQVSQYEQSCSSSSFSIQDPTSGSTNVKHNREQVECPVYRDSAPSLPYSSAIGCLNSTTDIRSNNPGICMTSYKTRIIKPVLNHAHMATHVEDTPYSCDQCPYKTSKRIDLIRHKWKHTGERPYSCDQCPYKTGRKHDLMKHKRKHTGERPYTCDQCLYSAAQKQHLIGHIKSKH